MELLGVYGNILLMVLWKDIESERVDLDMAEINYEPIIKFLGKNGYGENPE